MKTYLNTGTERSFLGKLEAKYVALLRSTRRIIFNHLHYQDLGKSTLEVAKIANDAPHLPQMIRILPQLRIRPLIFLKACQNQLQ